MISIAGEIKALVTGARAVVGIAKRVDTSADMQARGRASEDDAHEAIWAAPSVSAPPAVQRRPSKRRAMAVASFARLSGGRLGLSRIATSSAVSNS